MKKIFTAILLLFITPFCLWAQENVDASVMQKIREEGLNKSKVMEIVFNLTEKSGSRLTNSPGFMKAAQYAKNQLTQWGLQNAVVEPWGEFGKSWELNKAYFAMSAPYYKPIIGFPKSWTSSTNGLQNAEVLLVSLTDSTSLEKIKGQLKGKVILIDKTDAYKHSFTADANRYSDEELQKMQDAKPVVQQPADTAEMRRRIEQFRRSQGPGASLIGKLKQMAVEEGAVAMLSMSTRGHDGTIFVQGGGSYAANSPENFLDVALAMEDYMMMVRLSKSGTPVKMEIDVKSTFSTNDTKGYNVIAEIKGTDPTLKDEIVMLGGHLDSWHGSLGATDNASGCSVMMEAVRIINALGLKPKRTIRIALWSGEEQGLLGSRAYVKKNFADPSTMKLLPDHEKFSSYFNIDNGTGKIRGIYLQGNEACKDIFTKWLEPFHDLGAKTVTIRNTGGTDHQSFDAVGLPGFQFIQDEIEYDTRTHHTTMDSYDHLIADDLKQMATIVAAFVYNAASRTDKLPRKELPKPRPSRF